MFGIEILDWPSKSGIHDHEINCLALRNLRDRYFPYLQDVILV